MLFTFKNQLYCAGLSDHDRATSTAQCYSRTDGQPTSRPSRDGRSALSGVAFGMPSPALVSRTFSTPRQTTHYIECGPADGPLMFFLHGWPELSLMWRAQLDAFAADGWRCVAPDLRGYGGSSAPAANDAYTNE